ncbi:MAG: hypothetical protein HZA53_11515, partial [Planctomycetes bacterium]|nr:hypothetical protein [Planctomycetota bacterium]
MSTASTAATSNEPLDAPVASVDAPVATLDAPVASLRGIGPAKAKALERIAVRSVRDLVFLLPRRARAAGDELSIAAALERRGEEVTVRGAVERLAVQRFGRRNTLRIVVRDASGSLPVLFFNQPWLRKSFELGKEVVLRGRIGVSRGPALLAPRIGTETRPLSAAGTIELLYPSADGVSAETVGRLARELAARCASSIDEPLPAELLAARDLLPLAEAVRCVHAPPSIEAFERARRRLALEPLLRLQARLIERRRSRAESGAAR